MRPQYGAMGTFQQPSAPTTAPGTATGTGAGAAAQVPAAPQSRVTFADQGLGASKLGASKVQQRMNKDELRQLIQGIDESLV